MDGQTKQGVESRSMRLKKKIGWGEKEIALVIGGIPLKAEPSGFNCLNQAFGKEQLCKQVTQGHNIVADGWAGASNPHPHPNPHPHTQKNI